MRTIPTVVLGSLVSILLASPLSAGAQGMVLPLPPHCSMVYSQGAAYSDCSGTFYQPASNGYMVVAPPAGAMLSTKPAGATWKIVGSTGYWFADGVYYRPYYSGGQVVYQIVVNPT